jgi:hypothetical protein
MRNVRCLVLALACVGVFVGGCQQWVLTVPEGNMEFVPARAMEIEVHAEMDYYISSESGITARPFAAPRDQVALAFGTGHRWLPSRIEKIDSEHYVYVFTGELAEATEFALDPGALIVNSKGLGAGPYRMTVDPVYVEGLRAGQRHRETGLGTYRIVVDLRYSQWSPTQIEAFLAGFEAAYAEAGQEDRGRRYTEAVWHALSGDVYEQGHQEGRRHVNSEVTDAYVQTVIGRTAGQSAVALAWKAGYIDGFAGELVRKTPSRTQEDSLRAAETMYNSLKRGMGF